MNNQPQKPPCFSSRTQYENDETTLVDLWQTLSRGKLILALVFLTVQLTAAAYLFLTPRTYESQLVAQIGQVATLNPTDGGNIVVNQGTTPLEDLEAISQRLVAEFPALNSANSIRGGAKNIIVLTLRRSSKSDAEQQLRQVGDLLLQDHLARYNNALGPQRRLLSSLTSKLQVHSSDLHELMQKIEHQKAQEPVLAAILQQEKVAGHRTIVDLEARIASLESTIETPYTFPTTFLGEQNTPASPVKPNLLTTLAFSLGFGLAMGIFAVYFTYFIARVRKEAKSAPTGK